ncbi:MAG: hypothetical protein WBV82_32695 [Myxococcaceae bacterium]
MTATDKPALAETIHEPDGRTTEMLDLPNDEATLLRLFRLLFEEHATEITFGPCIQGAVFEIHADRAAKVTMLDGYLTVGLGAWHFHLCIGGHRGYPSNPCPPELARHRRVKRAALFRTVGPSCVPASWGLRLWNGHHEQMITVFFPNPHLNDEEKRTRHPDWSRLRLWNEVRREFLGLAEDPRDREHHPE